MNLLPYLEDLHRQLLVAADAGGDDARALAERLTAPLESAARLVLLDALSAAAAEISRDLAPGSVDLRLRGTDPEFVVDLPAAPEFEPVAERVSAPVDETEDGGTTRTTLRLPDSLKTRMEQAAAREGISVNTWLVRAVSYGVGEGRTAKRPPATGEQTFTGWAR
jgi:hypothetical protein